MRSATGQVGLHYAIVALFQLLVLQRAAATLGAGFGSFAFLLAAERVALVFCVLGMHATVMRLLAMRADEPESTMRRRIITRSLALRLALLLAIAAGLVAYLAADARFTTASVWAAVALVLVMHGLMLLLAAQLQGLGRYAALAGGSLGLLPALLWPTDDLASLLGMIAIGYATACAAYGAVIVAACRARDNAPRNHQPRQSLWRPLLLDGIVLSAAAALVEFSDQAGVLLLEGIVETATYNAMAFGFLIVLYPARLTAVADAVLIPRFSALVQQGDATACDRAFDRAARDWRTAAGVVVGVALLGIDLVVRTWFDALPAMAAPFTAMLLVGLGGRMLLPVARARLIATGRMPVVLLAAGAKLAADVLILLSLHHAPMTLAAALVAAWLVYEQALRCAARGRSGIDWLLISMTIALLAVLMLSPDWTPAAGAAVTVAALADAWLRRGMDE